jgi:integrase/recombinase XerC
VNPVNPSTLSRARIVRRKATRLGLKMRAGGNIYTLTDSATREVVVTGGIGAVENYVNERFEPQPPGPPPARIPAAWQPMINDYCLELAAGGQTERTVRMRRLTMAHIARGLNTAPADVTGEQLVFWFGRQTHWSRSTRKLYRASARGFFSWAYRRGRVPRHIADELPKVRDPTPSPRPVPDQVWRDALAAASPRVKVMMRLAAEAGLRRAEVAQVHTRDLINDTAGWSLIVHGKGDKTRTVPISDSLAELIRTGARGHTFYMPAKGYLFPPVDPMVRTERHLTPEHVGILVGEALPEGWSMHKLRHRYATRAYRGTRNLRAVQTLLGHASIATTEHYVAVDDTEVRAAAMAAILVD